MQSKAKTVSQYLAELPPDRRKALQVWVPSDFGPLSRGRQGVRKRLAARML